MIKAKKKLGQGSVWGIAAAVTFVIFVLLYVFYNQKLQQMEQEFNEAESIVAEKESSRFGGEDSENPSLNTGEERPDELSKFSDRAFEVVENTYTENWSYIGEMGPANWGFIDARYSRCENGQMQSPINITGAARAATPEVIKFNFSSKKYKALYTGINFIVSPIAKPIVNTLNASDYQFVEMRMHMPSEHRVDDLPYKMEWHLIHRNPKNGRTAVVALFIEDGKFHKPIDDLITQLPHNNDEKAIFDFNFSKILPKSKIFYFYKGSMTFPPCDEDVSWYVFKEFIQISEAQLGRLGKYLTKNIRPLQARNNRVVEIIRAK